MPKQRIIIFGGTGFIGKNLVLNFAKNKNYSVVAIYNKQVRFKQKNVKWIKANLLNEQIVKKIIKKNDIVIQAAATTSGSNDIINSPYLHVTDNALMNSIILRVCHKHKIKHFIFFSCTVMYSSSPYRVKENDLDLNKDIYENYFGVGWTKVYIEKMCEFFSRISNTKFTVIRHSNIYGEFDKFDLLKSHVFGASITKVMTAKKNVKIWGEGKEKRDLLYVGDLVEFVDKVIKKQKIKFELINVGLGKSISVLDLVKKIIKHSNKNLDIILDKSKKSINTSLALDIRNTKKYNWEPKTDIDKGIIKTIKWWKENYK